MTTTQHFAYPKDPLDTSWYSIRFNEPLASIISAATAPEPVNPDPGGGWTTPGDALAGTNLTVQQAQLSTDALAVNLLLVGGVPGLSYAVRVGVLTVAGSTLYRSAIISVTGL